MKRNIKIILFAALAVAVLLASCFASVAEDEAPVLYTIENADGNVVEYNTTAEFNNNVQIAPSGSIITLHSDIELISMLEIHGTAQHHKELTLDLAGHGLYSTSKSLVSTMLAVRNYATLNVTSSKPDAFLYMVDFESNSTKGGNIFSVSGKDALVNFGGTVSLKGTKHPGSNVSTFSSCFVDMRGTDTVGFNCDGGQHFANIADWMGFINPRNGTGTITIKNADILVDKNGTLIHSEESTPRLYLENCLLIRLDGETKYMFNQIHCDVVIKDCISNYSLVAQNASSAGIVTLEGNNVFGAGLGFAAELLKESDGKVAARTNAEVELVQGGTEFWRYDNSGRFNKLHESIPALTDSFAIVDQSDTFNCRWEYDGIVKHELWVKGQSPTPPHKIVASGKGGMYKKGWLKTRDADGEMIFKATTVNDFSVKIRPEYEDDTLCYHIFVPAFVFDDGYISYLEGKIDGAGFSTGDWTEADIGGESYYEYITMNFDDEDIDRVLEISIPCDMVDGNKLVKTEGIYRINLSSYIAMVRANESSCTADQLELVAELESRYFPAA